MPRFDLIAYSGVIKEYKPMNWRSRRAYSRRIDRALRFVSPPDFSFGQLCETVFWVSFAALAAAMVIAFPIMFVRWWLCM